MFFFVVISFSEQNSMNSFVGLYTFYNLFLCLVWTFEVTLPIMVHGWGVAKNRYKIVELVVVLYFMVDAVITIFAYDTVVTDRMWVVVDATITMLLFLYMTIETAVLLQYSRSDDADDGTDISLGRIDKDEQVEISNLV